MGKSDVGRVRVYLRPRPRSGAQVANDRELNTSSTSRSGYQDEEAIRIDSTKGRIEIDKKATSDGYHIKTHGFNYDQVFSPESTQKEVYEAVGQSVVDDVLQGYNGTIFAYGQTGTGKTHTILSSCAEEVMGGSNSTANFDGIIPQCVGDVFAHVASDTQFAYSVCMSYVQIYMDSILDLLRPESKNIMIREDPERGLFLSGVCTIPVVSGDDVVRLLMDGSRNRHTAFTKMNAHSSRSHAALILTIERVCRDASQSTGVRRGKLMIFDLAGSERVKKSGVEGLRKSEAAAINSSLSALGNCIHALVDRSKTHVPFRDSTLTRMLQDSLGGNAKTSLVVTVSQQLASMSETYSSLLFGQRAMNVTISAKVNEEIDYKALCERLTRRIHELEAEVFALKKNGFDGDGEAAGPVEVAPISSHLCNRCLSRIHDPVFDDTTSDDGSNVVKDGLGDSNEDDEDDVEDVTDNTDSLFDMCSDFQRVLNEAKAEIEVSDLRRHSLSRTSMTPEEMLREVRRSMNKDLPPQSPVSDTQSKPVMSPFVENILKQKDEILGTVGVIDNLQRHASTVVMKEMEESIEDVVNSVRETAAHQQNSAIEEADREINIVKERLTELEAETADLRNRLLEKDAILTKQVTDNNVSLALLDREVSEHKLTKEQLQQSQACVGECRYTIQQLQKFEGVGSQIHEMTQNMQGLLQDKASLTESLYNADNENKRLQSENVRLLKESNIAAQNVKNLQCEIADKTSDMHDLHDELKASKEDWRKDKVAKVMIEKGLEAKLRKSHEEREKILKERAEYRKECTHHRASVQEVMKHLQLILDLVNIEGKEESAEPSGTVDPFSQLLSISSPDIVKNTCQKSVGAVEKCLARFNDECQRLQYCLHRTEEKLVFTSRDFDHRASAFKKTIEGLELELDETRLQANTVRQQQDSQGANNASQLSSQNRMIKLQGEKLDAKDLELQEYAEREHKLRGRLHALEMDNQSKDAHLNDYERKVIQLQNSFREGKKVNISVRYRKDSESSQ